MTKKKTQTRYFVSFRYPKGLGSGKQFHTFVCPIPGSSNLEEARKLAVEVVRRERSDLENYDIYNGKEPEQIQVIEKITTVTTKKYEL